MNWLMRSAMRRLVYRVYRAMHGLILGTRRARSPLVRDGCAFALNRFRESCVLAVTRAPNQSAWRLDSHGKGVMSTCAVL